MGKSKAKKGRNFALILAAMVVVLLALSCVLFWKGMSRETHGKMDNWLAHRGKQVGLAADPPTEAAVNQILPVSGSVSANGQTLAVTDGLLLADGRLFLEEQLVTQLLGTPTTEAGTAGTAGTVDTAGTIGTAGTVGTAGTADTAGTAGTVGTAGTADTAGTAGTAGTTAVASLSSLEKKLQDIQLNEKTYISINHVSRRWGVWPVFNDQGVSLYRYMASWDPGVADASAAVDHSEGASGKNGADSADSSGRNGARAACLRLEDIMADASESGRFTHDKLEKLRTIARWLQGRGQEYSVAWIPLYTNPKARIQNDLTREFNWYNADFLFTLDTMAQSGGHIGLHGLTHQYNEEPSAAGYEFGKDTPFSSQEVEERIRRAIEIAGQLGYSVEFFEFPHYGMTKPQGELAEKYFTVIYQQELWTKPYGQIETKEVEGRSVMYVPTPADCVQSEYDKQGMLSRLADSREKGELVSLFFHPSLDYSRVGCVTGEDGVRRLSYDEAGGILPAIVRQIDSWGMRFSVPWPQPNQ